MSEIALYNVLTKLGVEHKEAEAAVADVARKEEVATKSDLRIGLAELETRLTNRMYSMTGLIVAAMVIIKYLPD